MPNEQLRGKPQFCSDIYAVGMLAIQALTGFLPSQLPEDAKTCEIIWRDKWYHNTLPQQVRGNSELADVLDQMVRYDYRQRYQTATEALQAFQGVTDPYSSSTTASASEFTLSGVADPFESTVTYPRPAQVPGSPSNSPIKSADPFGATVTYPKPAQVPGSPSDRPIEADEPTQAPPSQQLPTPDAAANLLDAQVGNETSKPSVSQSRNKSYRLIAIGAGIVTALALTVGTYHVQTSNTWNKLEKISLANTLSGHSKRVSSIAMTPDGQLIASGSNDKTVKLWNLQTGKAIRTLTGFSSIVYSVAISPDGQTLISGAEKLYLWHLPTGKLISTISDPSGNVVAALAMTPDGETLVSGSNWGKFSLWNLPNLVNGCKGVQPCRPTHILSGSNGGWVHSLAISPDGKTLATGSDRENTIKLWNASTGEPRITISNRLTSVESLAFSPDGKSLVTNGKDGTIEIWRSP